MRLTDITVRALAAPEKGAKIYYDDSLKGFGVRVSQAGTKAFILATGKNRDRQTIGRYPIVSLAEARQAAKTLLAERQLGRHQAPKTTLGTALDLFTEKHVADLAPRTQKELVRLFTRYLTKIRSKKLADVTTHDITDITDKSAPSEAEHFHRACKTFFRWCVGRRLIPHSPLEGLEAPAKGKPRERVLTDDELRALWRALEETRKPFGDICKLLILTGVRRSEAASIRTEWIDFDKQSCTLPGSITKNKRQHCIPLSALSFSIVRGVNSAGSEGLLFASLVNSHKPFGGWSKAKARLDKKMADCLHDTPNTVAAWTLHDLRRTYATNLQRLGIRTEVIEALLNHVSGTRAGIVGVYQKHRWRDEMVDAVQQFEQWFTTAIVAD